MNPALKTIGRISELLGVSPLSQSPIWNKSVDAITQTQLTVFLKLCEINGKLDQGETAIHIAQREVSSYISQNQLDRPAFLDYRLPQREILTLSDLKLGLETLSKERAHAVLFALETGLDGISVAMLTHTSMRKMQLTSLAKSCAECCPRQINLQYVFWEQGNTFDLPLPLFGLDADVFDAFGLVWGELETGYKKLMKNTRAKAHSTQKKSAEQVLKFDKS